MHHIVAPGFVDRPRRSDCTAGQMDREAGWWTTSGNIRLPPLTRVMGVGRQQQQPDGEISGMIGLPRTKRIQPARGWCATVGGTVRGNTVQIVSTYPASPEARPPSFFGEASRAFPQHGWRSAYSLRETLSPTQDQGQHSRPLHTHPTTHTHQVH